MKRLLVLLLSLGLVIIPIAADEFHCTTSFEAYSGGYTISSESHWTADSYRYGGTIQAMIKVETNNVEVTS